MSADTQQRTLDPEVIEARTQAIGRELIGEARRAHAHFSVLNRWTEEVLSWCLDPALKSAVLRFIDVLPSLRDARDVARHVREYFPTSETRLPGALQAGTLLARPGLPTARALSALVHQLVERVARQFIAGPRADGIRSLVRHLTEHGAGCSLDVLGEQVMSDGEADAYAARYRAVLGELASAYAEMPPAALPLTCGPRVSLSVKLSGLAPRFDPLCPAGSIAAALGRLRPILQRATDCNALVYVDMEHYQLRDLTFDLVRQLLEESGAGSQPALGVVVQAYLCDAEASVDALLDWLAAQRRRLTVRLVKGAYWDYEVAQAAQKRWPVPVHLDKAATDAAFERLTLRLLRAHPVVTTAIASHNVRSIAHAMAAAESLGLAADEMEIQLLFGMGEAIQAAVAARGCPVRVYTPLGDLVPGMAYLVRRILENTANESVLRRDFLNEADGDQLLVPPAPAAAPAAPAPAAEPWRGEPLLDFARASNREGMSKALDAVRERFGDSYPILLGEAGGEERPPVAVRNPADPRRIIGEISHAGVSDVARAVAIASAAQAAWGRTPVSERITCLRRAAALLRERRAPLAAWEIFEVGKTWREADADVVEAIDHLEYYGLQMERLARGRPVEQPPGERNDYVYTARGVTAVISPWNFPLAIPAGMVGAALVAGNAVVLKPAEQSSITAFLLVSLLREAGVPAGAVQYLPGEGESVGAALVAHAEVAQILFTGSRATGLSIIEEAARVHAGQRHVKRVIAEMGGKNAIIVDADADLDAAVAGTLVSAFGYSGQKCSAASRVIVHRSIAELFLRRLGAAADRLVVGDPVDPCTEVGPLIDESAQRRLLAAAAAAAEVGTVVYRCPAERLPPHGHFVAPLIVADVPPQHRLAREELFGPLLCAFRADDFETALALANDTDYALTGGIYSRSPAHVAAARRDFDVGNLYVNRPITGAVVGRQPFGGHRLSGLGSKAGGPDYLQQLLLPKTISEDTRRHGMPLD
jgi:RHH-type proline utilization regulon transcriptional repressor/proline dehydrogenase/delta 1-pyrroline-5-carboxylate dehydrogenase